ncbi:MAG: PLP-dependent lyase/thiolase [Candidatus Magasanikbacteria bacterium]|nr:PLP-dependent lyase/thiolase [Candidatus Magasanikbacteria bacterium]
MKTIQMPYAELARALGVKDVYLKREDQHKYGSHKGRSIPLMLKKYFKEDGKTDFVISSSGNAALAAIHAVQAHNRNNPSKLRLTVFVGQNIDPKKIKLLLITVEDANIKIEQVERPKQSAFQMDKDGTAKILRQSTDDSALLGYLELAEELDKIPNLAAIFIPTSSGTTAQGLGEAFWTDNYLKLSAKGGSASGGKNGPQIHIVQTTSCHPIAEAFNASSPGVYPERSRREGGDRGGVRSLASAIVDHVAMRKEKVIEIIKTSNGSGWIVSDKEIVEAINLTKETCNLAISANSALSVAGLKKAALSGWQWNGPVVCLVTGM